MKPATSSALFSSRAKSIFLLFSPTITPPVSCSISLATSRPKLLAISLFFTLLLPAPSFCMEGIKALIDKHNVSAEQVGDLFIVSCQQGDLPLATHIVKNLLPFASPEDKAIGLMLASQNNRENIVVLLLSQSNIHPDSVASGLTPLRQASQNGHLPVVKMLIAANADIEALDERDISPLHAASANGHANVVQFFMDMGAKKTITAKTNKGLTPLYCACQGGHAAVVELLLRNMEKADIDAVSNAGVTALCAAVQNKHFECTDLLMEAFADATIPNEDGFLVLHAAAQNDFMVPDLLLDFPQTVNAVNKNGITPLHMAAAHDKIRAATTLLMAKADPTLKSADGKTPFDCATSQAMKKLIEEYPAQAAREAFLEQLQECMLDGAEAVLHSIYPQNKSDSDPEEEEEEE
jgi:ankyrin repeat protein